MTAPDAGLSRRAQLVDAALYAAESGGCEIDLSDNTNLWGAPPAALRALREDSLNVARYPQTYSETLKRELGRYLDVEDRCIVTGCGSDDVLDCAFRTFADAGAVLAIASPSFSAVPMLARANGLAPVEIPLTADGDVDVDAITAVNAAIVYLCSPNNPTGGVLARESVMAVTARSRGIVILDEAYAEFVAEPLTDLAMTRANVFVTRTMSKAFGLAGLRVGYGIGDPALVNAVETVRGPYKVNAAAERAAIAALREDRAWVRDYVREIGESRERFCGALRGLGLAALPSSANFVLLPMANAVEIARQLRTLGVGVRAFSNLSSRIPALQEANGSAIRITIGPWPAMGRAVDALAEVIARCA